MRTTIEIPDTIFRKAKAVSSLKGIPLKKFITMAIEHELEVNAVDMETRKVELPLVPSKRPGAIKVDSATIAGLLENEDTDVTSRY